MVLLPTQMGLQRWWEQEIPVDGTINKGELMTHNLTELIKPESYEVRLTPITRFGEGDSAIRIVTYSGKRYILFLLFRCFHSQQMDKNKLKETILTPAEVCAYGVRSSLTIISKVRRSISSHYKDPMMSYFA